MRADDILLHFDSQLGVSFPHLFEKPHIIKEIKPDDEVLDLGCGIGQTTLEFAEFPAGKGRITGIDFSPRRIQEARRLAARSPAGNKAQFMVGDAEALDVPDATYTLIISQGVLLHVIDKESAVKEMYRVLKRDGRALISLAALNHGPSLGWDKDMTGVPVEWTSISDYEEMFSRTGFRVDLRTDLAPEMKGFLEAASGRYAEALSRVPQDWCYPMWRLGRE